MLLFPDASVVDDVTCIAAMLIFCFFLMTRSIGMALYVDATCRDNIVTMEVSGKGRVC